MRFFFSGATVWMALGTLFCGLGKGSAWALPPLTAQEIIQKTLQHAAHTPPAQSAAPLAYTKIATTDELDAQGQIREHRQKVYQISLRDGSASTRLVEVNGRPPTASELKKQAQTEVNAQQLLGQSGPADRGDARQFLTPELAERFNFYYIGQSRVQNRPAYVLCFEPRNPPPPIHRMADRVLDHVSGTVWIDQQDFEVAQAEVELDSPVDLLGGVLGALKKMDYSLVRTRVRDGLWLNTESSGEFEGRKFLVSVRIHTHSAASDFHSLAQQRTAPAPLQKD